METLPSFEIIITHAGTAHWDEFLACCLLVTKFPVKKILRVDKLPEKLPENSIVLDLGGRYDDKRFFDHHQDPEIPSTLILILRRFFPELDAEQIPWVRFIDAWDRWGPRKAQELFGIKLPSFNICPIDVAVLHEFSKRKELTSEDPLYHAMKLIGSSLLELMSREKQMLEKARNCKIFSFKGLKIVMCEEPVKIEYILRVHGSDVAVVIQPNTRSQGKWSLIRINDHSRVDFRRILGKLPADFVHANGFLAVVDKQHIWKALELAIK